MVHSEANLQSAAENAAADPACTTSSSSLFHSSTVRTKNEHAGIRNYIALTVVVGVSLNYVFDDVIFELFLGGSSFCFCLLV